MLSHTSSSEDVSDKEEVVQVKQLENVDTDLESQSSSGSGDDDDIDAGWDPKAVARTMRKVDWRLIPVLAAMYTVSGLIIPDVETLTWRHPPWTVPTCPWLERPIVDR